MGFEKICKRPLKVYFSGRNGFYFKYQGKRYYLDLVIKTDSDWYYGPKADFIHGVHAIDCQNPVYVGLVSGDDGFDFGVNVYKYNKEENEDE